MYVEDLRRWLKPWEDCRVLNRGTSVDGAAVSAAALTLRQGTLSLWLVQQDPTFCSRLEEAEMEDLEQPRPSSTTNREALFGRRSVEAAVPVDNLQSVAAGGVEYRVDGTSMGRIENDWQQVLTLAALLQAGWEPGDLDEADTDSLFLLQADFQGTFNAIPTWDGPLELRMHPGSLSGLEAVDVTPGAEPVRLALPCGEVFLLNWEALDPWAQLEQTFSDPKILAQFSRSELAEHRRRSEKIYEEFCPRGMVFPALRYEAAADVSIQCYLNAWLDAPIDHRSGALGILARPDEAATGPRGLPVRLAAATDLPINPGSLEELAVGAIRWSRKIPLPPLKL